MPVPVSGSGAFQATSAASIIMSAVAARAMAGVIEAAAAGQAPAGLEQCPPPPGAVQFVRE